MTRFLFTQSKLVPFLADISFILPIYILIIERFKNFDLVLFLAIIIIYFIFMLLDGHYGRILARKHNIYSSSSIRQSAYNTGFKIFIFAILTAIALIFIQDDPEWSGKGIIPYLLVLFSGFIAFQIIYSEFISVMANLLLIKERDVENCFFKDSKIPFTNKIYIDLKNEVIHKKRKIKHRKEGKR